MQEESGEQLYDDEDQEDETIIASRIRSSSNDYSSNSEDVSISSKQEESSFCDESVASEEEILDEGHINNMKTTQNMMGNADFDTRNKNIKVLKSNEKPKISSG